MSICIQHIWVFKFSKIYFKLTKMSILSGFLHAPLWETKFSFFDPFPPHASTIPFNWRCIILIYIIYVGGLLRHGGGERGHFSKKHIYWGWFQHSEEPQNSSQFNIFKLLYLHYVMFTTNEIITNQQCIVWCEAMHAQNDK